MMNITHQLISTYGEDAVDDWSRSEAVEMVKTQISNVNYMIEND